MLDDGPVLWQGAEDVRFNQVFVLLRPTRIAFALRAAIGPLFDGMLADGIRDHLGRLLIGGGKIDLIAEIKQEDIGLFPAPHRWDVRSRRLRGIDGGGSRSANLIHHVVIRNPVLADKDGFLGLVQHQHDKVLPVPLFGWQIVPS